MTDTMEQPTARRPHRRKKDGHEPVVDCRWDVHGPIRWMTGMDGYVMVRRPAANPFVMSVEEWEKLPETAAAADRVSKAVQWGVVEENLQRRSTDVPRPRPEFPGPISRVIPAGQPG